ncbi:asparagine synthase-related protein [Actinosynnema sp. CS-041913]|uniref:asparagine synthase-related protein n=1 Tax=Actinosynnema sp. CS-041913 TaxID=3239917 RepID=UPI003D909407
MNRGLSAADGGHGEEWFVVLPDDDSASAVATAMATAAGRWAVSRRVDHPSGRPWLMGRWDSRDLLLASAGRTRVAVLGYCPASIGELALLTHQVAGPAGLDRVAGSLAGSFHLVASVDGVVRAQGSVSGVRRVFHTRMGEVDVAADRADTLARLTGAGLDERQLVTCLMYPQPPPALTGGSYWHGVAAVPEEDYLLLTPRTPARTVGWWRPPPPTLSLTDAAPLLRQALVTAVGARTRSGRTVSADLSGGVDSTAICSVAVAGMDRLTAFTVASTDPADDDGYWAGIAAAGLGKLDRLVVTDDDLPAPYQDILCTGMANDEPYPDIHLRAEDRERARLLTARGAQLHLTGDGGDEVLPAPVSYLPALLRRRPRLGLSHLRGMSALHRWSWPTVWRRLTAPRDERSELLRLARTLTAPDDRSPGSVTLAPWASADAVRLARELLIEAADRTPAPMSDWVTHDAVRLARCAGRTMRRAAMAAPAAGLPLAAPFLDDRVVEACLTGRPHERTTPWRYKPLLVEAMRGIVPDHCLTRTTKGGTTPEHAALPLYRADLLTLCQDARLADLGLVDPTRLRSALTGIWTSDATPIMVEQTIGCERWLRDLTPTAAGSTTLAAGAAR